MSNSDLRKKYSVLNVLVDTVTAGCTCGFGDDGVEFDVDWGDPDPIEDCLQRMQTVHDRQYPSCGGSVLMYPDPDDIMSVELYMHCTECGIDKVSETFTRGSLEQAQAVYEKLLEVHKESSPNCQGQIFIETWRIDFAGDVYV